MAKLTERQKKNIIAAYAAGGVSYGDLAKKYGVSDATICRVIGNDPEFAKKCNTLKNESEEETFKSLKDYFSSNQRFAKNLIGRLLDIPDELIAASTLRERVGAASYIKEMFLDKSELGGDEEGGINVTLTIKDLSEGAPDA